LKKILITGAYGLLGNALYRHLASQPEKYEVFGLDKRRGPSERTPPNSPIRIPDERFHLADIRKLNLVRKAVKGRDIVIHLAAEPRLEAPWTSIFSNNILGAYHVFKAAKEAGVKRIIFASSIAVVMGYQSAEPYNAIAEVRFRDVPQGFPLITHRSSPRPIQFYGKSKLWGETLGRFYAKRGGASCLCLRIGAVNADDHPKRQNNRWTAVWCSLRDFLQLAERCVDADEKLRFDIFYAVSKNRRCWVDLDHARRSLVYEPLDCAEDFLEN